MRHRTDWYDLKCEEQRAEIRKMKEKNCDERNLMEKFLDLINIPAWIVGVILLQVVVGLMQAYFTNGGW